LNAEDLHGRWIHSHEEDSDEVMVFRRPEHQFPRSRGRQSIDLRADGSYSERSPGPVDVPVETSGKWRLAGDRLELEDQVWELAGVEPDRLTVRR
jgi:hypothetical protein